MNLIFTKFREYVHFHILDIGDELAWNLYSFFFKKFEFLILTGHFLSNYVIGILQQVFNRNYFFLNMYVLFMSLQYNKLFAIHFFHNQILMISI